MKSFAEIDIERNGNYLKLLSSVSQLSGLFSESSVPFINYRVAENIFCRSFDAGNLSRSDTAFDANYNSIGVGLKTFVCNGNSSTEKVAEFNSLSRSLNEYKGKDLAIKLGEYRNYHTKIWRATAYNGKIRNDKYLGDNKWKVLLRRKSYCHEYIGDAIDGYDELLRSIDIMRDLKQYKLL